MLITKFEIDLGTDGHRGQRDSKEGEAVLTHRQHTPAFPSPICVVADVFGSSL